MFPITLDSGSEGVSSLDFQLRYDPEVFTPVEVSAGSSASAAGKVVDGNTASPGSYNVLVMGLNKNSLPPGAVANVVFERNPDASQEQSRLAVDALTLSDAEGGILPSSGGDRTVAFANDDTPEPSQQEPEKPAGGNPETGNPAPPVEPPAQANPDAVDDMVGQQVADAMLASLSKAAEAERKAQMGVSKGDATRVSGEETQKPRYSIRERRFPVMQVAGQEVSGQDALPAALPKDAPESGTDSQMNAPSPGDAEPAKAGPPELKDSPAPAKAREAEAAAMTVEPKHDVPAQAASALPADEGGRENAPPWRPVVAAFAAAGLILTAVVWRRKRTRS